MCGFMLLQLSEKYGQHIDELTADGFSVADTASKVTPLLWLCGLLVPFCSLLAWEQLRHALLKANHYWLQLMQIVVMVLTFLGGCGGCYPFGYGSNGAWHVAIGWFCQISVGVSILQ